MALSVNTPHATRQRLFVPITNKQPDMLPPVMGYHSQTIRILELTPYLLKVRINESPTKQNTFCPTKTQHKLLLCRSVLVSNTFRHISAFSDVYNYMNIVLVLKIEVSRSPKVPVSGNLGVRKSHYELSGNLRVRMSDSHVSCEVSRQIG